jgi:undecaprenyl pyrophosphate synthase
MWPDFTPVNLAGVIADFRRRERRFGGLSPTLAAATA